MGKKLDFGRTVLTGMLDNLSIRASKLGCQVIEVGQTGVMES